MAPIEIAFETTRPVTQDAFFGRNTELENCLARLNNGQSVLVTGESRIGKTSFLMQLRHRLSANAIVPMAENCDTNIDATMRSIHSQIDPRGATMNHRLVDSIAGISKQIVVFLNDFDTVLRLSAESEKYGFVIKSLVDAGHSVVCASAQRANFTDAAGQVVPFPLVSFFYELPLKGLDNNSAADLLRTNSAGSGDQFSDAECNFIIDLAGTVPHRLQNIGFDLIACGEFKNATAERRLALLTEMTVSAVRTFTDSLTHRMLENDLDQSRMNRLIEIAHDPVIEDHTSDPDIHFLQKRGFLAECESPFRFHGNLFRDFLRAIPLPSDDKRTLPERLAGAGKVAVDATIKTAIGAAFA